MLPTTEVRTTRTPKNSTKSGNAKEVGQIARPVPVIRRGSRKVTAEKHIDREPLVREACLFFQTKVVTAQLSAGAIMAASPTSETLITLAARVPQQHRDAIDDLADQQKCSRSEYVAGLIRDHVNGSQDDQLLSAVHDQQSDILLLQAEIRQLRNDLASVLELVLLNVTNLPEQEVRNCVSRVLRHELQVEQL